MDIQQFLNRPPGKESLPGQGTLKERLVSKLAASGNVAITGHQGWGKIILARDSGFNLTEKYQDIKVFYFDLKTIYDTSTFVKKFIQELCKSISSKIPNHLNSREVDLSFLDLTEKIAARRGIRLIIFISNFQFISHFNDSNQVMKELKFYWRQQSRCAYCISGRNHHFFWTNFNKIGSPMSGFGRVFYLKRNLSLNYVSYVKSLFFNGGKMIESNAAKQIALKTNNHLFYLQQLCWNAFIRTNYHGSIPIVEAAFESLILQYQAYLETTLSHLTKKQFNYLRALLSQTEKICSGESLKQFDLGRSSNVARIRENLVMKEIIEVNRDKVMIIDPVFEQWLMGYI